MWSTLNVAVVESCSALFQLYQTPIAYQGEAANQECGPLRRAFLISFSGDALAGRLLLVPPPRLLALSLEMGTGAGGVPAELLNDWGSELANQLLGGVKKRLYHANLKIEPGSLPSQILWDDGRRMLALAGQSRLHLFRAAGESLLIQVQSDIAGGEIAGWQHRLKEAARDTDCPPRR